MKRIYLLAYITILCCLCPLLKAQLGPMPFTPVPPNDPSLVRLLNSDVRCRQWVDSVMQRLTLKERIGQLFIYTIAPQQDKANKELLRKVVEDYKVGGLLFSGGLMQNQVMLTNEAQRMAEVPLMITFDGEWGLAMRLRGTPNFPRNMANTNTILHTLVILHWLICYNSLFAAYFLCHTCRKLELFLYSC